ncbi:hypothetical protein KQX54_013769 [Cotesia glomerata]|uniref:Uncharacterized protein n=1 Tax=Cotesia glomerata TaxID=32391 RepID=A0AAV7IW66_COTGL|nr:hypothetical protein KQX54_013769 [Cotesia glomerata]
MKTYGQNKMVERLGAGRKERTCLFVSLVCDDKGKKAPLSAGDYRAEREAFALEREVSSGQSLRYAIAGTALLGNGYGL